MTAPPPFPHADNMKTGSTDQLGTNPQARRLATLTDTQLRQVAGGPIGGNWDEADALFGKR